MTKHSTAFAWTLSCLLSFTICSSAPTRVPRPCARLLSGTCRIHAHYILYPLCLLICEFESCTL